MGFIVDAVMRLVKRNEKQVHIHELCEQEHCDCEDGIFKSAVKHTLHVVLFIFLISLVLGGIIEAVGEDVLGEFLAAQPMLSVFASCLVGLIPNCAASVVITELFLEGTISTGAMMGGLLTGAGIGLLVLFRANRPMKQNLLIVAMLGLLVLRGEHALMPLVSSSYKLYPKNSSACFAIRCLLAFSQDFCAEKHSAFSNFSSWLSGYIGLV